MMLIQLLQAVAATPGGACLLGLTLGLYFIVGVVELVSQGWRPKSPTAPPWATPRSYP